MRTRVAKVVFIIDALHEDVGKWHVMCRRSGHHVFSRYFRTWAEAMKCANSHALEFHVQGPFWGIEWNEGGVILSEYETARRKHPNRRFWPRFWG